MPDHKVTRVQKNAIFKEIQARGLDPAAFSWLGVPSTRQHSARAHQLRHAATGYVFTFDVDANGSLWAVYRPGRQGSAVKEHAGTWPYVWQYLMQWLDSVKADHEAPDLWSHIAKQKELTAAPAVDDPNTPFSPDEQALIGQQLRELKELLVGTYQLDGERQRTLEARLDYLEGAAKRVGRLDWRQILVGELVALVAQAVIPESAFQQAGRFLWSALGHLFGGGFPELPGPY